MAFFQGIAPIVRGECNRCGHSRNLWVSELGSPTACDHQDRGCRGTYEVVYTGPKAGIPPHLQNVTCTCQRTGGRGGASGSSGSAHAGGTAAQLLDMGFSQLQASQAAARFGDNVGAAVEWLTCQQGPDKCSKGSVPGSADSASAGSSSCCAPSSSRLVEDVGECSICCEELLLADAAMRCRGQGGKKHYFHAHCLAGWVRECQRNDAEPTCPECRGPVQVRPRRLQEFLEDKGKKLDAEDRRLLSSFHRAAAENVDETGWSDIKKDLLMVGLLAAAGIGLAFVVGAVVNSFANKDDGGRNRGRRS